MKLAHRGGVFGTKIKENTLKSFSRAMNSDTTDGIECDLVVCKTGEIVIHHDLEIYKKKISETTLKSLPNYIPTLTDLLDMAKQKNYLGLINLEIKVLGIVPKVLQKISMYPELNIMLSSFWHTELLDAKDYSVGFIMECQPIPIYIEYLFNLVPNSVIVLSKNFINFENKEIKELVKKYPNRWFAWTVNVFKEQDFFIEKGIHIITDIIY